MSSAELSPADVRATIEAELLDAVSRRGGEIIVAGPSTYELVQELTGIALKWRAEPTRGWCPVAPNTVSASASALRLAAQRYRAQGTPRMIAEADTCDELAARLGRALERWRPA